MKKLDFNKDWTVRCLTREEPPEAVTLPHDAMLAEPRNETSLGGGNISWFVGGDYEYTRTLDVPADWADQTVVFEFEGVYHNAEVYINGEKAAFRPYGYTNFYVAANDFLKYGEENEIRVIAHNADQPNSRWYSGTGMFRPAWIWTGKKEHILLNSVRVRTVDYKTGEIKLAVKTSVPGTVKVEILEGEADHPEYGAKVPAERSCVAEAELETKVSAKTEDESSPEAKGTLSLTIPDTKLWDTDSPNLYTARLTFGEDVVEETFGVRTLAWDAKTGITLNGKRKLLLGGCIHHDNGLLGACSFPEAEDRRVRLHKELGYNALRSAHNPCSKALLAACDRHGMLMMDEFVDCWYMHKTKYDYVLYVADWWQQDLRDMVEKDFNHPSVIMYSTGNEVAETAQKRGIEFAGQMTRFLHKLDPTRPVSCGINIFFNFLSSIGLGVYSDDKAEAESARAEAQQNETKKKKPVGSEFYNTLATIMGDKFMKFGATLYPCDLRTKGAYANMDIAGYNYGIWRYRHDMKKYPDRLILGSETFCKDEWLFMDIAKDHPQIVGDFVWASMDYLGESGDGAPEYDDYRMEGAATPLTGGNGRLDLTGKKRADGSYSMVCFNTAPGPFIGVLPADHDKAPGINGWFVTKAIESWAWNGCDGRKTTVEIYARAAEVELFLNGRSIARRRMGKTWRELFAVTYEPGELVAVSYDDAGAEIGRCRLKSAGEETVLNVLPESETASPEGIVYIRLRYTDENGIWKPLARHMLQVEVENGTLLNCGSANSYVDGCLVKDTTDTYYGEAQAIVRAAKDGDVKVTVTETDTGVSKTVCIPVR